jgi:hypothetical protein
MPALIRLKEDPSPYVPYMSRTEGASLLMRQAKRTRETNMRGQFLLVAGAIVGALLMTDDARAQDALKNEKWKGSELPAFEMLGFPITRVQVSVLGAVGVQESSPVATLTLAGMPASPHQIAVLTPRPRTAEQPTATKLTTVGAAR